MIRVRRARLCGIIAVHVLLLVLASCCRKESRAPESPKVLPPDLRDCTRIEVRYQPSTLEWLCIPQESESVLSSEERQHLQSLEMIIVDDPNRIMALAHDIALGQYKGVSSRNIGVYNSVRIACYRGDNRVTAFQKWGTLLVTEDGLAFTYDEGMPSMRMLTPQLQPFKWRVECWRNIRRLWGTLYVGLLVRGDYPAATSWCDTLVREYRREIGRPSKEEIGRQLRCPAMPEGKCHYAMNPNCRPDSPPDTVLLFETKDGWNQHGGPELFAFDNHDPRGGFVVLKKGVVRTVIGSEDPIVRFIRTEEELRQLRWK